MRQKLGGLVMFRIVKITGTIIVHDLDNVTLSFIAKNGHVMLPGDINISDRVHEIAAHIIAHELRVLVIWQDIGGNKHFVRSDAVLAEKNSSMLDPRDNQLPSQVCVC